MGIDRIIAYLDSDITLTFNYAETSATMFQIDDEGTANFQITHKKTEKDTEDWLFMIVADDKRIIKKAYIAERMSSTELKTEIKPERYRVWLQLLDLPH